MYLGQTFTQSPPESPQLWFGVSLCTVLFHVTRKPASTHRKHHDREFSQSSVKSIAAQCVTAVAMARRSKPLRCHPVAPLLQAAELNLTSGCCCCCRCGVRHPPTTSSNSPSAHSPHAVQPGEALIISAGYILTQLVTDCRPGL